MGAGGDLKEKGNAAIKAGNYEAAVEFYTQAIFLGVDDDSFSSILYSNRAMAFLKLFRYCQALTDARASISFNKNNVKAYHRAASALMKLGHKNEAKNIIEQGLKVESENQSLKSLVAECSKLADNSNRIEIGEVAACVQYANMLAYVQNYKYKPVFGDELGVPTKFLVYGPYDGPLEPKETFVFDDDVASNHKEKFLEKRLDWFWKLFRKSGCQNIAGQLAWALNKLLERGITLTHEGEEIKRLVASNTVFDVIGIDNDKDIQVVDPETGYSLGLYSTYEYCKKREGASQDVLHRMGMGGNGTVWPEDGQKLLGQLAETDMNKITPHWFISAWFSKHPDDIDRMIHIDLCGCSYKTIGKDTFTWYAARGVGAQPVLVPVDIIPSRSLYLQPLKGPIGTIIDIDSKTVTNVNLCRQGTDISKSIPQSLRILRILNRMSMWARTFDTFFDYVAKNSIAGDSQQRKNEKTLYLVSLHCDLLVEKILTADTPQSSAITDTAISLKDLRKEFKVQQEKFEKYFEVDQAKANPSSAGLQVGDKVSISGLKDKAFQSLNGQDAIIKQKCPEGRFLVKTCKKGKEIKVKESNLTLVKSGQASSSSSGYANNKKLDDAVAVVPTLQKMPNFNVFWSVLMSGGGPTAMTAPDILPIYRKATELNFWLAGPTGEKNQKTAEAICRMSWKAGWPQIRQLIMDIKESSLQGKHMTLDDFIKEAEKIPEGLEMFGEILRLKIFSGLPDIPEDVWNQMTESK